MIRKLLLGVAFAAMSANAFAADLPSRTNAPAPVYAAPASTWAGLYAGVNAGYASVRGKNSTAYDWWFYTEALSNTDKGNGFIGGAQVGYNFQSGTFVYGVETDLAWADAKGKSAWSLNVDANEFGFAVSRTQLNALGTLRARAGVAMDRTLLYITGGLAYGQVKNSYVASYQNSNNAPPYYREIAMKNDNWRAGWTLGAGVEQALANNWTVKLEGLYYDLGGKSMSGVSLVCLDRFCEPRETFTKKIKNDGFVARLGLNYTFGGPAPVVAKY